MERASAGGAIHRLSDRPIAVQNKMAPATQIRTWMLVGIMPEFDLLPVHPDQPYALAALDAFFQRSVAKIGALFLDQNYTKRSRVLDTRLIIWAAIV